MEVPRRQRYRLGMRMCQDGQPQNLHYRGHNFHHRRLDRQQETSQDNGGGGGDQGWWLDGAISVSSGLLLGTLKTAY